MATPGPEERRSASVDLTEEQVNLFTDSAILSNLIDREKVALFDNELWYFTHDTKTINILKSELELDI